MRGAHDSIYSQSEREALILTLRQLSHRPLADFLGYIAKGGARAEALKQLTLLDLVESESCGQRSRHAQALRTAGEIFDAFMLEVLREVYPRKVKAAYLRTQLGGPRWKLRASLAQLEAKGLVVRTGTTSDTSYRAAP